MCNEQVGIYQGIFIGDLLETRSAYHDAESPPQWSSSNLPRFLRARSTLQAPDKLNEMSLPALSHRNIFNPDGECEFFDVRGTRHLF